MRPHIAPTAFLIGTFFRGCDLQGGGFPVERIHEL
jgi:hypothetical protein